MPGWKFEIGESSLVMLMVEGHSQAIGLWLACVQSYKITLADQTLEKIRALQERGRTRMA